MTILKTFIVDNTIKQINKDFDSSIYDFFFFYVFTTIKHPVNVFNSENLLQAKNNLFSTHLTFGK